ncbi:DUF4245 domain-containing protein [Micromonospora deserti]|uniref:DUF4245 domain-containing protein n=1 Tax=Micromonospora deserti TaxID=2070366 RepID=A0A2W2C3L8_9ACTN|nr:DUF4245 domain-containing protein [Micromonospora deserti]PZF92400.1 DUF4245 domain-containing protein [Micromonospora deserti]
MEPAQPADRVPADQTPPDDRPPAAPTGPPNPPRPTGAAHVGGEDGPARSAGTVGEPALVERGPVAPVSAGEPALTGPSGVGPADAAAETGERPAPPAAVEAGRSDRSPKDMALSLLVLLIPIALLLAFYRGFLGGDQPTTVDPAPAIEQARAANAFPVSAPGLGDGWRTVSASYQVAERGSSLRLGYLTPEGRGAQLVQSSVPPERLLPTELTDQGQPQGQTDLGGRTWQRYTARGNEQALVLLEPNRTVIVVGDARDNELRHLATSLG